MGTKFSDTTKQNMKTFAKYTAYTAGSTVVLGSVVAVGLSVVNNLFKPEYLSKLGENNLFKIAAAVGFTVMAIALIGTTILCCNKDKELQEFKDAIKEVSDDPSTKFKDKFDVKGDVVSIQNSKSA
ncbi:hypothetical protein [Candidatus Mesenet endosymbiont of Phosphuga atrata]|uniref:hypothetical protein n=1 Tax=Candidatus Mesenet endosymbiont of Phosphuga atrata TaxID=3066221 RepID=UPI0030CA771C